MPLSAAILDPETVFQKSAAGVPLTAGVDGAAGVDTAIGVVFIIAIFHVLHARLHDKEVTPVVDVGDVPVIAASRQATALRAPLTLLHFSGVDFNA